MAKHVRNYLDARGFKRVSFERIRESISADYTDEALLKMIEKSPDQFRRVKLSGNKPGLALVHRKK
jgi:hypothetical protein